MESVQRPVSGIARRSRRGAHSAALAALAALGCHASHPPVADAGTECGRACDGQVVDIGAGPHHSCALYDTGAVVCWGVLRGRREDGSARRGDGPPPEEKPPPAAAEGIDDAVQLAVGFDQTCVLRPGGVAWCWGRNDRGEVVEGSRADALVPTRATRVDGLTYVATGDDHTCAAKPSWWGVKWWPDQDGIMHAVPVQVSVGPNQGNPFRYGHTCVVAEGGAVFCTGHNTFGQAGYVAFGLWLSGFFYVEGADGSTKVIASLDHTCALHESGGVLCWGNDDVGQLGDGSVEEGRRWQPMPVAGLDDAVDATAGPKRSCAVRRSGSVVCWGDGTGGVFGEGVDGPQPVPVEVAGVSDAVRVAIGTTHACALLGTGAVVCWGDNAYGQAGFESDWSASPLPVVGLP